MSFRKSEIQKPKIQAESADSAIIQEGLESAKSKESKVFPPENAGEAYQETPFRSSPLACFRQKLLPSAAFSCAPVQMMHTR